MTKHAKKRRKRKKRKDHPSPPPPPPPPPHLGPVYIVYDHLPAIWRPFSAVALNEVNLLLSGIGFPRLLSHLAAAEMPCGAILGPHKPYTMDLCRRPPEQMVPPKAVGNAYMEYDGNTLLWGMVAIAEGYAPNTDIIIHELSHIFTRSATHGTWTGEEEPFDEGSVIFP